MSDLRAIDKLFRARDPHSHPSGAKIWASEARAVVEEFRAPDPDLGKPEGKFSDSARGVLTGQTVEVLGQPVEGFQPEECSQGALRVIASGVEEAARNRWSPDQPARVLALPVRNGHVVFLTEQAGFAVNAEGRTPDSLGELGDALYHAGEWVQSCFGTSHNLFSTSGLDLEGRRAVLTQFRNTISADSGALSTPQQDQLLGNIGGLLAELIKSVDVTTPVPGPRSEQRALIHDAFAMLIEVLDDPRLSPPIKHQLVGYLAGSDSIMDQLIGPERAEIQERFKALNPEFPFDYEAWDHDVKSNIRVDHIAGLGEGFLYGFTRWLEEKGLGDRHWTDGRNNFTLVHGDPIRGPVRLELNVAASDPINAWGRDMKVELDGRYFRNDMLSGLGKPEVDITGYDGHSGFGRHTLESMPSAPAQQGPKLLYRWVCAGVDAENEIARHAPEAYANSYTTQDSGYFRKRSGPPEVGEYAYEAEGWEAIRCLIRGVLGKKSHAQIQSDMKQHANWWGHSPGNDNNCVGPGDRRRGGSGDWDRDGVPNMFDVMPSINTFDVAASVANEFTLKAPSTSWNRIRGDRAFQAIQFVNTATGYNSYLKRLNYNRQINAHPEGVWFDGLSDPNRYVRFEPGPEGSGSISIRLNSALSNMTMETLRCVLFYETARYLLDRSPSPRLATEAARVAAALLFAKSSLVYDSSYRDQPVFEGLKKIYGIPPSVSYETFRAAQSEAAARGDYMGNLSAVDRIVGQHGEALGLPGVGQPAVTVTPTT